MYFLFLTKVILPIGSLFFSGNYSKYLRQWKFYDKMTEGELDKLQSENVSKLLEYVQEQVPYYKNLNISPNPKLEDFPILTKSILRKETDSLISEKYKKEDLEKNHSSGSSGEQSYTYMAFDHKFYLRALQTHWWMWGGYKPGEILIQTGISPKRTLPKKLKDIFFRTTYLEAFTLKREKIRKILQQTENKNPKHLAGYPSALNEMALIAISENKVYPFKSLISYGDKLFDHHKRNFSKAFKNPVVVNTYGCAEGLLIACNLDSPYYYIMSPHVAIEIVDEEGNLVKDGERGHILVTCLSNYAMPLIRYKLGDLGILLPKEEYPEKLRFNYPLLKEITGRETDVIKTPKGDVLIVHTFTGILEYYDEIVQFKIIQTTKNKITIEYISKNKENLPTDIESEIQEKLSKLTDHSMDFNFGRVEKILPSPSGKPQIIELRNID